MAPPLPIPIAAYNRPRTLMGYVSANREPWTLCVLAWEIPASKRARKNTKMLIANPDANTMRPKAKVAHPMIGKHATKSVGQPPHGRDPQHQEAARDAGHERDGPSRDVKRGLYVGREDS